MKTASRIFLFTGLFLVLAGSIGVPAYASNPPPPGLMGLMKQGKLDEARLALEARVKASPADLGAANDLALFLANMGEFEASRRALETALLANPESATAFRNLRELASQQFAESYAKAIGKTPPKKEPALNSNGLDPIAMKKAIDEGRTVLAAAEAARKAELARVELAKAEAAKAEAARLAAAMPKDDDVEKRLMAWAQAWSRKDFNAYSNFYSESFSIPAHKTRAAWLAFRKPRILGKKEIVVEVSDISITPRSAKEVEVRYNQRYESGSLRVRSRKTQVWVMEDGAWKIRAEQN
jgi:tetratricopeptide (TPR) repeat protein